MTGDQVTLAVLQNDIKHGFNSQGRRLDKIEEHLSQINGGLGQHETRITVMEKFCHDRVSPALDQITQNRVDIAVTVAKIAAGGLGVGGGIGLVVVGVAKASGLI